ncbi:MAG: hypothetical protein HY293_05815 [Planctomycetes bacterium]|nr:hypothetical protein [Planctomycetota bacterium]
MNEDPATEVNFNLVSVWLDRARANAGKCFICMRIAEGNAEKGSGFSAIRISGIELSPELQIAHLSRCVGKDAS